MTNKTQSPRRSRRWVSKDGLPHLAAQLPRHFRSARNVNAFIYSLAVEVTAGRVDPRRTALLGYLSQLALQSLAQLRIENDPKRKPMVFQFVSNVPRPLYPPPYSSPGHDPQTTSTAPQTGTSSGREEDER